MVNHKLPRLSATLLFIGVLLLILATYFHNIIESRNQSGNGNNHPAEFTAIAAGGNWTAVHLGQFVATAIMCISK
jgi:hypothetical protein